MNPEQVQQSKRSVAKVMGVHRGFDYQKPYLQQNDVEFGGTAFFVDPEIFGEHFPTKYTNKRFALTNFHVVDELYKRECYLCYPKKGKSKMTATVIYIVPQLDVAVLMVDPHGEHPLWFDQQNIETFIASIPNLTIDERPVKGNSQNVMAIGFPNLSTDYQLCEGCISGRSHAMIQISISLNGGNSGGPLMMDGAVIGICTASILDSEALGLAVPIWQALQFFQNWSSFESTILALPSWGMKTRTTSPEYLEYFDIESSTEGCSIHKLIPSGPTELARLHVNDIILLVESDDTIYKVDNFGLVSVEWADKRVKLDNQEFILSLNPEDIHLHVFDWKTKKDRRVSITLHNIKYQVRDLHHCWENVPYAILGGMVFMDLCKNHLEIDEEEEEEDDADDEVFETCQLTNFSNGTMNLKPAVILTHIPAQTHIASQQLLRAFDRLIKCNDQPVQTVIQFEKMIKDAVRKYNKKRDKRDRFMVLETDRNKVYLNLETLRAREAQDAAEEHYPSKKCHLLKLKYRKRKRRN